MAKKDFKHCPNCGGGSWKLWSNGRITCTSCGRRKEQITQEVPEKTTGQIAREFIREFAELNLKLVKQTKDIPAYNQKPDLLRELRENARVLRDLNN